MLFLKRILARWAYEGAQSIEGRDDDYYGDDTPDNAPEDFKNPLNITLYNAVGGRIVKFHSYDRNAEQSLETTYIIPSDLDFEVELGKCIAMESLKHTL